MARRFAVADLCSKRGQILFGRKRATIRFFIDPETGIDHIADHGVDRVEVEDVLRKPLEEMRGRSGTIIVHGQTRAGRYLKVIYVPDDEGDGIFVVTAYDLSNRQLHALRRRLRRRP